MARKVKKQERFHHGQCQWVSCNQPAEYPAPRFKIFGEEGKRELIYFCLDHVREYNNSWDFFRGMREEEILAFQKDAITGHRKTKKMRDHKKSELLKNIRNFGADFIFDNLFSETKAKNSSQEFDSRQRKALSVLDLEPPATMQEIKLQYKKLVKKYHPDINGGKKIAEEKFKIINEAYNLLKNSIT
jgi:DnaJ-domain-containing protein 1